MAVSLDLEDPVITTINFLTANFSATPVEVTPGFTRGGYTGTAPEIIPVEGPAEYQRKGRTNLISLPAKSEVLVYNLNSVPEYWDLQNEHSDKTATISIDIQHIVSRARLVELYNEIVRCLYKSAKNPGGNWSSALEGTTLDLTNRNTGLFRKVLDITLIKVSDFVGHE